MNIVQNKPKRVKHFLADTRMQNDKGQPVTTFLNDNKVDELLYGLLMRWSVAQKNEKGEFETRVYKKIFPTQQKFASLIGVKSVNTYKAHLNYLVSNGYLIDKGTYYVIDTYKESCFFPIVEETLAFFQDTLKERVLKTYIYLGQRWKFKGNEYKFTLEELGKHIGKAPNGHSDIYTELNNILLVLKNNGLIDYCRFFDGKQKWIRLTAFSFEQKKDDENVE